MTTAMALEQPGDPRDTIADQMAAQLAAADKAYAERAAAVAQLDVWFARGAA